MTGDETGGRDLTEAGKKWVDEKNAYESKYHPGDGTENAYETPKFWLSAFARLVREEANQLALANSHGVPHDPNFVDVSEAFDAICQKFGLEGK